MALGAEASHLWTRLCDGFPMVSPDVGNCEFRRIWRYRVNKALAQTLQSGVCRGLYGACGYRFTTKGRSGMLAGRCQCGAVRYEVDAAPIEVYVCHCTECRKQSSSAFGISVIVPSDALRILQGTPTIWSRPTATGKKLSCAFCGTCGSRLWHANDPSEETLSIKGGSLETPIDLSHAFHIWTQSKLPGIVLPDNAICFDQEPV